MRNHLRITAPWLLVLLAAAALVAPAAAEAGDRYVDENGRPFTWTFPGYIGNIGVGFGYAPGLDNANGTVMTFYKHLEQVEGPFYFGFEVAPFSFGTIYDEDGFPALHMYSGRAGLLVRLYTDTLVPEIYFDLGVGVQYTRFSTADDLAVIQENGYDRDHFGRWRMATRVSIGMEFGFIGLEFGVLMLTPDIEIDYSPYTPTVPVEQHEFRGMGYFAVHLRFGDR